MRLVAAFLSAVLGLSTGGTAGATQSIGNVYVAGVSSGGYMANQLHVAHSGVVRGAAIFSAGPYHCARGSLITAQLACMQDVQGRGCAVHDPAHP